MEFMCLDGCAHTLPQLWLCVIPLWLPGCVCVDASLAALCKCAVLICCLWYHSRYYGRGMSVPDAALFWVDMQQARVLSA
jgi:hypothetical protein